MTIRYLGRRGRSGLHAKVVIRDHDTAIVSSANWTGYALSVNAEAGILTTSSRAITMLIRWYDYLFERARGWSAVREEWEGED
jgi:phosphatidylserine/phosphatidylglycerophosphate/cardiolipin synthase-like enzyme